MGHVTGLRARGAFEVEMTWREGRLTSATIRNLGDAREVRIRYGETVRRATVAKGGAYRR